MIRVLEPSRTVDFRAYGFFPLTLDFADALLVIQNGVPGPRGGMQKCSIRSYWVCELAIDPLAPKFAHVGRTFLLAKREGWEVCIDDIGPYCEESVYVVRVWPGRGYQCSCTGWKCHKVCKHSAALYDLCNYLDGAV